MSTEFKEVKGSVLTGAKFADLGQLPAGKYAGVTAASHDQIAAWNDEGHLFEWKNGKWERDLGCAGCISASILPDGEVWHINRKGDVYHRIKTGWTKAPGAELLIISAANNNQVVASNAQGALFQLKDGKWEQDHGSAGNLSISIGVDGELWTVNRAHDIFRRAPNNLGWRKIAGKALKVAVHDVNNVFILTEDGHIDQHVGEGQWARCPGEGVTDISVGNGVLLAQHKNNTSAVAKRGGGGSAGGVSFPLSDANSGQIKVRVVVGGAKALRFTDEKQVQNCGGDGVLTHLELFKHGADKYQLRRGDKILRCWDAQGLVDSGGGPEGPWTFFKIVPHGDGVAIHFIGINKFLAFNGENAHGVDAKDKAAVFYITAPLPDFPLRDANNGEAKVRVTVNGAQALRFTDLKQVQNCGGDGPLTHLELFKHGNDKYQLRRGDKILRCWDAQGLVDSGGGPEGPWTFFKFVAHGDGVAIHFLGINKFLSFNGENGYGVDALDKAAVFKIVARS